MEKAGYHLTLAALICAFLLGANQEANAADVENLVESNRALQDEMMQAVKEGEPAVFKKKKIGIIEGETKEENFDVDKLVAAMSVYSALGYGAPPIGLLSALLVANGWSTGRGGLTELATLAYTIESAGKSPRVPGDLNATQARQPTVGLAGKSVTLSPAVAASHQPPIKFVSTPYFGRTSTAGFTKPI